MWHPASKQSGIKKKFYQRCVWQWNEPGYLLVFHPSGSNLLQRADGIGRTGRNYQAERKRWVETSKRTLTVLEMMMR